MQSKAARRKLFVGVTGGIGSGKSLVCRFFEELGCKVFYADELTRSMYVTSIPLRNALLKAFGKGIIDESGKRIDLVKFRNIVFSSERNQKRVNSIVHPFVISELLRRSKKLKASVILVEAALIFESGFDKYLDYTIEVYAPAETRIKRVKKRNPKLTIKNIKSIIKLQMPDKEKVDRADFIIQNTKTVSHLKNEVTGLYRILLGL